MLQFESWIHSTNSLQLEEDTVFLQPIPWDEVFARYGMFRWMSYAMPFWMPSNGAGCRKPFMAGIALNQLKNEILVFG